MEGVPSGALVSGMSLSLHGGVAKHSCVSENPLQVKFAEYLKGEVVRRIHLLGTSVNRVFLPAS